MTLRKRIVLIITGIIVFGIAGPVIIFVAQGYSYDFEHNRLVPSGAIVIKTEPREASVKLNGKYLNHTPLTRRFLHPGEYLVEITKDGYLPWQKRVNIAPRQVTYLPPEKGKIFLFLENQPTLAQIDEATGILAAGDSIFFLSEATHSIYRLSFEEPNPIFAASTTISLDDASIVNARTENNTEEFLLASQNESWYVTGARTVPLPGLSHVDFGQNLGTILGLNQDENLVEVAAAGSSRIVAPSVAAFQKNGNDIYYLARLPGGKNMLYHLDEQGKTNPITLVPAFYKADIIASPQNYIYLLLDNELFEVNEEVRKLRGGVDFAFWDNRGELLLFGNNHETWIHAPLDRSSPELLIRSTRVTSSPLFHKTTGHAFWIEGNDIKAIEADNSGQPNIYTLLTSQNPKNIYLNEDGDIMVILTAETLLVVRIR